MPTSYSIIEEVQETGGAEEQTHNAPVRTEATAGSVVVQEQLPASCLLAPDVIQETAQELQGNRRVLSFPIDEAVAWRLTKPPQPKCAFSFFRAACTARDPELFAGMAFSEQSAMASQMWQEVKDNNPGAAQEFKRLANKDSERFEKASQQYEAHMQHAERKTVEEEEKKEKEAAAEEGEAVATTAAAAEKEVEEEEEQEDTKPQRKKRVLNCPTEMDMWIQCEEPSCFKWRRVCDSVDLSEVPTHFKCCDNTWNTEQATCEAVEDTWNEESDPESGSANNTPTQPSDGVISPMDLTQQNFEHSTIQWNVAPEAQATLTEIDGTVVKVAHIISKRRVTNSRREQYRVRWVNSTEAEDTYESCEALNASSRAATRRFEASIRPEQQPGSRIYVEHRGMICPAVVREVWKRPRKLLVHYSGWSNRWDEWATLDRVYDIGSASHKAPVEAPSVASSENEEELVEKIVDKRVNAGKTEYKVRWDGFTEEDDTWEPLEHLKSAMKLVRRFERSDSAGCRAWISPSPSRRIGKRAKLDQTGNIAGGAAVSDCTEVGRTALQHRPAQLSDYARQRMKSILESWCENHPEQSMPSKDEKLRLAAECTAAAVTNIFVRTIEYFFWGRNRRLKQHGSALPTASEYEQQEQPTSSRAMSNEQRPPGEFLVGDVVSVLFKHPPGRFKGRVMRVTPKGCRVTFEDGESHTVPHGGDMHLLECLTTVSSSLCSICQEDVTKSDSQAVIYQLGCGHLFHGHCITGWYAHCNGNGVSCPNCKTKFAGLRHCSKIAASCVVTSDSICSADSDRQ